MTSTQQSSNLRRERANPKSSVASSGENDSKAYGWRPGLVTIVIALMALVGTVVFLYPTISSWIVSYNQSKLIDDYVQELDNVHPSAEEQLRLARQYNDALSAGVKLEANANVPTGTGSSSDTTLEYHNILKANEAGLMGRIMIDEIDVDLPIYHGTDDATLLKGAGHLEGSHFPIGGEGTHSVITAHRGLATATMFDDLNKIEEKDRFTVEVFGEVLTYEVTETKVVEPEDTDTLRANPNLDQVTLITCTPLGINTHRILVTGERVTPTPIEDLDKAGESPTIPHFPWWIVILAGVITVVGLFVWKAGYGDARIRAKKLAAKEEK